MGTSGAACSGKELWRLQAGSQKLLFMPELNELLGEKARPAVVPGSQTYGAFVVGFPFSP